MKNVDQNEWQSLIEKDENAVVIDVRTPNEWMEGVQENALLINVMDPAKFEEAAKNLDKTKNYYVYCRSGQRSLRACHLLEATGIANTYNLLGGMLEWQGKTVIPDID
ncbi:rhodanese-like domain-containing protein [Maribacter thermophilus]|uniref:rhodanese-like domain-containing protein n=1 Tax=Maribacter thermophilus TaxID=1197874 RepID=UPI0006412061|nr:rhodanese-like domain-containing protein [Maribacter thermophilus]